MAKKPTPTVAKPQPATSSYLKAASAKRMRPMSIIKNVAYAKTVFLFMFYVALSEGVKVVKMDQLIVNCKGN